MNEAVAIIPARGGSKRIPRKNIRPFAGHPVITYAIRTALKSGCFAEVMVSTDCAEIAAVAREAGAQVPFLRSPAASDDHASTFDALAEVIDAYRMQGRDFTMGCCLYPVTPFLASERVAEVMRHLQDDPDIDSVVTVLRYPHPVQRALKIRDHRLEMFSPEWAGTRTQDLEPAYHDAGQCYGFRVAALLRYRSLFCPSTQAVILGEDEAQDVDTPEDWAQAELKYSILQHRETNSI